MKKRSFLRTSFMDDPLYDLWPRIGLDRFGSQDDGAYMTHISAHVREYAN